MHSTQPDLRKTGLADAIRIVGQRLAANRFLTLWLICCNWTVVALLLAIALMRSARMPLLAGLILLALAAIATALGAWYGRPSPYGIAQRLDAESHLGDRISTAVYFWDAPEPGNVILRQRGDALAHLAKIEPREVFPLQMPPKIWRTGVLLLALTGICAFHSVYGPPIPRLKEKAAQSHTLATLLSPVIRALELARSEKKELADLVASNDRDRQAAETQKPLDLPPLGQPTGDAQSSMNAPGMEMSEAMPMGSAAPQGQQQAKAAQPGQQAGAPANSQSGSATDQQAGQSSAGQQSLGQKALQALENLMSSALSGQQNNSQSPSNSTPVSNNGATSMQSMSGASQAANPANQAAQGQTSNSQGSQNQAMPSPGKHTGAGNGTSPWQPRANNDPQLAGNTAKEHIELQTTGFRGPPGKDRADVAPGTAQIPMQDVAPQTVTTVNGAGQDSVPPRYRQYVQDYFQHSEK
jgi:hypothetical protein